MRYANFIPLISNEKQGNMQNAPALPCDTLSNDIAGYTGIDKYGNCYNKCSQTCPSSDCSLECGRLIFPNMPTSSPPTTPQQTFVDSLIQDCKNNVDPNSNTCESQIIDCCSKKSDIVNKPSSGIPGTSNYSPSGMESCYTVANNTCKGIDSETGKDNKNVPLTTFPPGVQPVCPAISSKMSDFTGPEDYTSCMTYCQDNCSPDYNCYKDCDPLLTRGLTTTPSTIKVSDVDLGIQKCLAQLSDKKLLTSKYCAQEFVNCCMKDSNIVNYPGIGIPGQSNYIPSGVQKCYDVAANMCANMFTPPVEFPPTAGPTMPTTSGPVTLGPVMPETTPLGPATFPPETLITTSPPIPETLPPTLPPFIPETLPPTLPPEETSPPITTERVRAGEETTTPGTVVESSGVLSPGIIALIVFAVLALIVAGLIYTGVIKI